MATPPTLVSSVVRPVQYGASLSMPVSVLSGDLIIVAAGSGGSGSPLGTPTGGGLTWTPQQVYAGVNGHTPGYIWSATATASGSFTITVATSNNNTGSALAATVWVWRNHGGVGSSAQVVASATSSLSLTTTAADSAICVFDNDYACINGSGRAWVTSSAGAFTETLYSTSSDLTWYSGYHADAGVVGAKTVGMTAPAGQIPTLMAIEVKPATSALPSASGSVALTATGSLRFAGSQRATGTASGTLSLFASTSLGLAFGTAKVASTSGIITADLFRANFGLWYTVDASYQGRPVAGATGLRPTGGSITDTNKPGVRRTLNLELEGDQALFDLLAPIGTTLTVTAHVRKTDRSVVDIQMGVFDVDSQTLAEGQGKVTLVAPDFWVRLSRARFVGPSSSISGWTVVRQLTELIQGAIGYDQSVMVKTASNVLMPPTVWSKDRDKAIIDTASKAGLWVYFDRFGVPTIADIPTLSTSARWLIDASTSGTLLSLDRSRSRTSTRNVVIVESSASGGPAFPTQVVWDSSPSSPTYAGTDPLKHPETAGPFGIVPMYYDTPLPLDATGAYLVGVTVLSKAVGLASQVSLTSLPNPQIDAFDAIDVLPLPSGSKGRFVERHVVDTVTHSLSVGSGTQIEGRSTRTDIYTSDFSE